VHVSSALARWATGREGAGELPLEANDLAAVALEQETVAGAVQMLPLEKKPSEEILEGFDGERLSPARGRCGLTRRG
jgi:hypothetical protein